MSDEETGRTLYDTDKGSNRSSSMIDTERCNTVDRMEQ